VGEAAEMMGCRFVELKELTADAMSRPFQIEAVKLLFRQEDKTEAAQ
jgi:hypothetical protein